MPLGQSRPLHRLTQLADDPAMTWLSTSQRLQVTAVGGLAWVGFGVGLMFLRVVLILVLSQTLHVWGRLPSAISAIVGAALAPAARRAIIRLKSHRAAILIRTQIPQEIAVDDWMTLENHPDGQMVSVVGWIRGRLDVEYPVNGHPCVGLALPCEDKYPGVLESVHDFEITDESGNALAIRVAGGRMLGRSNVRLTGANNHRLLIASLDLPGGAVPVSMSAFVLRDGDPVMILGSKKTIQDPDVYEARKTCLRPALASTDKYPLLIFPLMAAEPQPGRPDQAADRAV
jgi:hypothetical protein